MTKLKLNLIVVTVLLFVSFAISPVIATSQPPVNTVDEDGDLVLGRVPELNAGTGLTNQKLSGGDEFVYVNGGPGVPSPVGAIYSKTPDYFFFGVPDATKYRVKVYDYFTDKLIYTLKGSGNCNLSICYLSPALTLKVADISGFKGYYYWTMEARVYDSWSLDPEEHNFRVYSTGFTTTFDTINKWLSVYGTWSAVAPGYLKVKPVSGQYSSVVQKYQFTDGYVFEVLMNRKSESSAENYIIVKGQPDLDTAGEDGWWKGIMFSYDNSGNCRLDRWVNHSLESIEGEGYGCNVHPYSWNKLTIFVNGGLVYVYMNGLRIYKIVDAADSGWVGIGAYEDDGEKNALLVDGAKLYRTNIEPYTAP